jgi:MinD superfamily P-loop ATPase
VISAASGADLVVIIAEPTVTGIHDMHRIFETTKHFHLPTMVCINKSDIYPDGAAEIESFCQVNNIPLLGKIPFDESVTNAMLNGQPVTYFDPQAPASIQIKSLWKHILEFITTSEAN